MAENDLGKMIGQLLGGQGGGSAGGILGTLLSAMTGGQGQGQGGTNPLGGLLDMLSKSGLGQQKDSWVGTGANEPVTGSQIQKALPDGTIQHVAQQNGVTPQQAADEIAHTLPQMVDKLSPNGRMPSGSLQDLVQQQNL